MIRPLRTPCCPRCGRELAFAGQSCGCRRRLRALSGLRSAAVYDGPVERAIHRLKYDGWRALAGPLAELAAAAMTGEDAGVPLVAVPLHPSRAWARGYNQAELLAAELRRRGTGPSLRGRLIRVRATPTQVGLDRVRRRVNVAGAFAWRGPAPAGPVLLVDDVATTGATLDACAAALRGAGASRVVAVTVARALT